jgi:hypothetical protein
VRVDSDILFMHAPEDVLFPIRNDTNVVNARVFGGCISGPFLHRRIVHDDQSSAVLVY